MKTIEALQHLKSLAARLDYASQRAELIDAHDPALNDIAGLINDLAITAETL